MRCGERHCSGCIVKNKRPHTYHILILLPQQSDNATASYTSIKHATQAHVLHARGGRIHPPKPVTLYATPLEEALAAAAVVSWTAIVQSSPLGPLLLVGTATGDWHIFNVHWDPLDETVAMVMVRDGRSRGEEEEHTLGHGAAMIGGSRLVVAQISASGMALFELLCPPWTKEARA